MKYLNAGNALPFYSDLKWQRHRQVGQDALPYGLPAPRSRLIPFQVFLSDTLAASAITWKLVNVVTGDEVAQSANLLEKVCFDASTPVGIWVTFKGDWLTTVPDCGFWYIEITAGESGEITVYSDVLALKSWANFEHAAL